jgi:hypothetical protein
VGSLKKIKRYKRRENKQCVLNHTSRGKGELTGVDLSPLENKKIPFLTVAGPSVQ